MSESITHKSSRSKPKVNQSSNNNLDLADSKITIDNILPHFILIVEGFINEAFERERRMWISKDIKNLVSFMYAKPVIMNVKYDNKMKYIFYCPVNETPIFMVKLNLSLNKMPRFETKRAQQILDIINKYGTTKQQMEMMIALILEFAMKCHCNEYIKLCNHLYNNSSKMTLLSQYEWVLNEDNISKTMRKIVIQKTDNLFQEHCIHHKKRDNFISVISLVAALYNVGFIKKNVMFKGIFNALLPPQNTNLTKIDLEGLCILFKSCGKKLDSEAPKYVDKYLEKLISHKKKFDLTTQQNVEEMKYLRINNWILDKKKHALQRKQEALQKKKEALQRKKEALQRRKEALQRKKAAQFWWRE